MVSRSSMARWSSWLRSWKNKTAEALAPYASNAAASIARCHSVRRVRTFRSLNIFISLQYKPGAANRVQQLRAAAFVQFASQPEHVDIDHIVHGRVPRRFL